MKKFLLFIPALLIFLGAGCDVSQPVANKITTSSAVTTTQEEVQNLQIATTTKQEDFTNKMECYNFKGKLQKDITTYNSQQTPVKRMTDRGMVEYYMCYEQKELGDIFYSNKLSSCLNVEIHRTICKSLMSGSSGEYGICCETYSLIDTLNNVEIDFNDGLNFVNTIYRYEPREPQMYVDELINEYK